MPDYEIRVAGPIGPAAAARLPGFTTTTLPPTTVLSGKVTEPDHLHRILDLLSTHGLIPIDIQIDPERGPLMRRPTGTAAGHLECINRAPISPTGGPAREGASRAPPD